MISPTDMEQVTAPPAEESAAPADSYSPPPARRRLRPPAWTSLGQSRERRWWTIALTATLLISATGIGLLYVDDSNNQATIRSLTTQNESLNGRALILQDQLNTTTTNLNATLDQLSKARADLQHPTLTIWDSPQQIGGPNDWLLGNIPDTFTFHLHVTSTGPMSVSILTLSNYVSATGCMDQGGSANYCLHHSGSVVGWLNRTSIDYDFHLAEGCAGYISVFTAATKVTVRPNVSVTYNPSSKSTGACA